VLHAKQAHAAIAQRHQPIEPAGNGRRHIAIGLQGRAPIATGRRLAGVHEVGAGQL